MPNQTNKTLKLSFHGRIIDHLGIQMYQSPVAAIAELISNTWDADAEEVNILLPEQLTEEAEIVIQDNGRGMTFRECQEKYLNVGWNRRGTEPTEYSPEKKRPILGRKGIGKFAGFGIAEIISMETVSKVNGERTVFKLDLNDIRGEEYVSRDFEIQVDDYRAPDKHWKQKHGTKVILRALKFARRPSPDQFSKSMARRFLLHQMVDDFRILVNGTPIPRSEGLANVEFSFPKDYRDDKKPDSLLFVDQEGWGSEKLSNGKELRWKIHFYKLPIEEEELIGVSVFCHGKMAQRPFLFNLSGGLGGQHGQQYISGQIQADYLDELPTDFIATERQRLNWDRAESKPLLEWGQNRIKKLLVIWHDSRAKKRKEELRNKVEGFSSRLKKLPRHEAATIENGLTKLAGISSLSQEQFQELGGAILTSWEQGRLRNLIYDISRAGDLTAEKFLELLAEVKVLVALNVAEAVRTKIETIDGLRIMIKKKQLEKELRRYIAENSWLLHPKWDTFAEETSVRHILDTAAKKVGFDSNAYKGRIDLALRSGEHLLVVEFVRPDKTVDWDHLSRCKRYIQIVRAKTEAETNLGIEHVTGLIVADGLDKSPEMLKELPDLAGSDVYAYTWASLLSQAQKSWKEFIDILVERAPEDERLKSLRE